MSRKEKMKEYQKKYLETHPETRTETSKKYYLANLEKIKEYRNLPEVKEKLKLARRKYYEANKNKNDLAAQIFAKENPDWKAAHCAKRRAKKKQAQPIWANENYIKIFYKLAKEEENRLGTKVVVDHIIPLQHPDVCGLHCEFNLQLLILSDNCSKGNKFDYTISNCRTC
jgi:hypothetical protein